MQDDTESEAPPSPGRCPSNFSSSSTVGPASESGDSENGNNTTSFVLEAGLRDSNHGGNKLAPGKGLHSKPVEHSTQRHRDATITTLMLRNLCPTLGRNDLRTILDCKGFSGLYNFLHLPVHFNSRRNHGFAFVNFVNPEVAWAFAASSREAGSPSEDWEVAVAEVQGLKANVTKAASKKMGRIRNKAFRPLFVSPSEKSEAP